MTNKEIKFFKKASFGFKGDEEVVAVPKGKEITPEENALAISEMTFYGSSKWREMVEKWREKYPQSKKELTQKEKIELEKVIEEANNEWKKLQEEKKQKKAEAVSRIEAIWMNKT